MEKVEGVERALRPDWVLLLAAFFLTGLGLVLVYSTSSALAFGKANADGTGYLKRSLVYAVLGAVACYGTLRLEPERLRRLAYPLMIASVVLLLLPWVPSLGVSVNGARRWVRVAGFGFQPSEFAKVALIVFLAHSLSKRGERVTSFAFGLLPNVLLPAIPLALIVMEPDLGTTAVLAAVVGAMAYIGGVRPRHLAVCLAPVVPLAIYALWFVSFRRERILAFIDPWSHARGAGFQLVQSLLAFGAGGVWGVGLGAGGQKLFYLPEAHTDFILSVCAEEKGLFGILLVLACTALFVWRGFTIAGRQTDPFRRLLATGISTWIGLQAGINALVVMGCLPTKGLPYPFLSYGGTGLVATLAAAGLLAGLARESAR